MLSAQTLIMLISALTEIVKELTPVIETVLQNAHETDTARIKSSMADLQARNDVIHDRVSQKLAALAAGS